MRPSEALARHRDRVLAVAAAHGAGLLRVFGSAARGDDRADSDLDLLVELPEGVSLFQYMNLQLELQDALGVRVDLCTEEELHPRLRDQILREARPV